MRNDHTNQKPDLAVIFDFGGVLIDWVPQNVYHQHFNGDLEAINRFLDEIGFMEWNARQDEGRPFSLGVDELCARYPHYCDLIRAYDTDWEKSIPDAQWETVQILADLRQAGYELYGLSNFSLEKFKLVRRRFEFFNWFKDILLSAEVEIVKPDPRIFTIMLEKIGRSPEACVYIDDSAPNIRTAQALGFQAIHFQSPAQLKAELAQKSVL